MRHRLIQLFSTTAFAAALSFGITRAATDCPDCQVSDAKRAEYDALLILTPAQKKKTELRHVPYGLPLAAANATGEHLLHQSDYLTWYDDNLRVPLWVAYKLTKKNVAKERDRLNCFRRDPRLSDNAAAECADYKEPIFDQGHLAPNDDFEQSEAAMINTFPYSNMTPQFSNFNQITWKRLEATVRMWVQKRGDLFVITGAVFDRDGDNTRDADSAASRVAPRNRVAIPTHFYKIIFKKRFIGPSDSIAIFLPHDNDKHLGDTWFVYMADHITTIRDISRRTGIDFLPGLSGSKRTEFENHKADGLWPRE
jgi:DNA/RNA endonuclease G (NUC1)